MPKDDPDALAEFQQAFGSRKPRPAAKPSPRPTPDPVAGAATRTPGHAHTWPPRAGPPAEGLRELLRAAEARAQAAEASLAQALSDALRAEREHTALVASLGASLRNAGAALESSAIEIAAAKAMIVSLEGRIAQLRGALERRPAGPGGEQAAAIDTAGPDDERGAVAVALRRFNNACLLHGVTFLVIVGGSPAYRQVLAEGKDRRIDLRLVDGNVSRPPRFPPRTRIFIWGATELDHSVSNAYPGAVNIPHRGISRFLDAVSERIEGSG